MCDTRFAKSLQRRRAERIDQAPVLGPVLLYQPARRGGGEWIFDLYEKRNAGETPKHFFERRYASLDRDCTIHWPSVEPTSRVERSQFSERHPLDRPGSVGRAIDPRVVNYHDFSLSG